MKTSGAMCLVPEVVEPYGVGSGFNIHGNTSQDKFGIDSTALLELLPIDCSSHLGRLHTV